jgi:hypothetical protein
MVVYSRLDEQEVIGEGADFSDLQVNCKKWINMAEPLLSWEKIMPPKWGVRITD